MRLLCRCSRFLQSGEALLQCFRNVNDGSTSRGLRHGLPGDLLGDDSFQFFAVTIAVFPWVESCPSFDATVDSISARRCADIRFVALRSEREGEEVICDRPDSDRTATGEEKVWNEVAFLSQTFYNE
jgi:hypothetical protein